MMPNPTIASKTTLQAKLLLDTSCELGEGAIWNHQNQTLYWVDIEQKVLHCFKPATGKHSTTAFSKRITAVVPAYEAGLVLALEDGIYRYNKYTREISLMHSNPENESTGNRFNDGKCDPSGRFWLGTMGSSKSAALYCFDTDYTLNIKQTGITNSNGILWSLNQRTMYHIDTPTYTVKAYDFDNYTGQISNPRTAITIPPSMGYPDGATIDCEGMIWIALWGGACVTRWNPITGAHLATVKVPAKNVTSCAFGGEGLDVLYITTARTPDLERDIEHPHSGGVFAVDPGVRGIQANFFRSSP